MRSSKISIVMFLLAFTVCVITGSLGHGFRPETQVQWLWFCSYAFTFAYTGILLQLYLQYLEEKRETKTPLKYIDEHAIEITTIHLETLKKVKARNGSVDDAIKVTERTLRTLKEKLEGGGE